MLKFQEYLNENLFEMSLNDKCTEKIMYTLLNDWDCELLRDYTSLFHKDGNVINISPYTDRFKYDIFINHKSYRYPKTINDFIQNCKKEGIELNLDNPK